MYNKNNNCWESAPYPESEILLSREKKNDPRSMFILADTMLETARKGKQTSEAVYLMETAANLGYAQAALAMAQMFQYGWGVARSQKQAISWYQKAAQLGSEEAAQLLKQLKRRKWLKIAVIAGVCALAVGILALLLLFRPSTTPAVSGVVVHPDTELRKITDLQEFNLALNDLIEQNDGPLVVSGQQGTNRLLLQFEGEGIDLSAFPAATVLDNGKNYLVIQFATPEEAQNCLKLLQEKEGIIFVCEDMWQTAVNQAVTADDLTSTGVPYTSPHTGSTYNSWGVEYMGMDLLAAWLSTQQTTPVTVAVLDTGSEPNQESIHRYLDGYDAVDPTNPNGWTDEHGHGTHVAGTIIDCTRGLDVTILPVRVLAQRSGPTSIIVQGLQYVIQSDVDVLNMSLGCGCPDTDLDGDCGNPKDYYVQMAVEQGIIVVVAAGNGDDYGTPVDTAGECPAHKGQCIVVAACDQWDDLASFSNYGESVDVCAPGMDILSYAPGGGLALMNGTSMATPHVAALAAMLKLYLPDRTPAQIEKYITDYCVDMGNSLYYGEGIPWAGHFAGD